MFLFSNNLYCMYTLVSTGRLITIYCYLNKLYQILFANDPVEHYIVATVSKLSLSIGTHLVKQ